MVEQAHIDSVLKVVENPVRRKIIKRLSQEPSYPLELAKEIGEAQQLVTSHLSVLEKAGIVGSSIAASPTGPNRRSYFLKQSMYLSISFGPHLFNQRFLNFEALPPEISSQATDFIRRITQVQDYTKESKIETFSHLLKDIDTKLTELEAEKTVLLFIRNLAMKNASKELETKQKSHDERRILHYLLDQHSTDIEGISQALNLKESTIRSTLEILKQDITMQLMHTEKQSNKQ